MGRLFLRSDSSVYIVCLENLLVPGVLEDKKSSGKNMSPNKKALSPCWLLKGKKYIEKCNFGSFLVITIDKIDQMFLVLRNLNRKVNPTDSLCNI